MDVEALELLRMNVRGLGGPAGIDAEVELDELAERLRRGAAEGELLTGLRVSDRLTCQCHRRLLSASVLRIDVSLRGRIGAAPNETPKLSLCSSRPRKRRGSGSFIR